MTSLYEVPFSFIQGVKGIRTVLFVPVGLWSRRGTCAVVCSWVSGSCRCCDSLPTDIRGRLRSY